MLDLVFLHFEVFNAKGNVKAAMEEGKGEFVGAFCTALGSLQPGTSCPLIPARIRTDVVCDQAIDKFRCTIK